jgi:molecular chaperone GrpE
MMSKKKSTEEKHKNTGYTNSYERGDGAGTSDQPVSGEAQETKAGDNAESSKPEESGDTVTTSDNQYELLEKLADMQDRYLRLSAEFDNYRKRTLKEKIDLTKTASESLLLKLLPVLDDFERGVKLMETATDCKAMKEGIDLIYTKFRSFLDLNGVKEIEAINKEFDVDLHDAVTKVPAPDKELKGKVVDVLEKGYMLNDKVIRFSKVIVGE